MREVVGRNPTPQSFLSRNTSRGSCSSFVEVLEIIPDFASGRIVHVLLVP